MEEITKTEETTVEDFSAEYLRLVPVILKEVEDLYGPRVGKVRFSGIIYDQVVRPELDYTEFFNHVLPVKNKVNIALTPDAKSNFAKGLFQLSHEVVHLLSTLAFDDDQSPNNLEEGLAVCFSKLYTAREAGDTANFNAPTAKTGYRYAYGLVKQLLDADAEAIKKLRRQQAHFTKITAADFNKAGLTVDAGLITGLLNYFQEVRPLVEKTVNGEAQPDASQPV